jgi:hypothetical protein
MACRWRMIAVAGATGWVLATSGAQAAPPGGALSDVRHAAAGGSGLERVAYRLCWTEGGARQCRWVDNARIYGYRAPRASIAASPRAYAARPVRVLGYAAPPAYRYRVAPVYGYVAPGAYAYRAPPVYGYAAPGVYAYQAPALGYAPAFAYRAAPPIFGFRRPYLDSANPDQYPAGTRAWWAVMNRQNRGGQVD